MRKTLSLTAAVACFTLPGLFGCSDGSVEGDTTSAEAQAAKQEVDQQMQDMQKQMQQMKQQEAQQRGR